MPKGQFNQANLLGCLVKRSRSYHEKNH